MHENGQKEKCEQGQDADTKIILNAARCDHPTFLFGTKVAIACKKVGRRHKPPNGKSSPLWPVQAGARFRVPTGEEHGDVSQRTEQTTRENDGNKKLQTHKGVSTSNIEKQLKTEMRFLVSHEMVRPGRKGRRNKER
ncbi:uncharacterized protein SPSK_10008 [Sporothrix schenckii 1099-18]|uniref:Uncharacterized protein n=1 Tax=Sporothrix schenckii 1099-18 TaxID=1397361 RepID=A0A0F2M7N9_SPOSC|nr:uncharacterized protein SPSK_10008 [Sporothrix schenckii 1099-18]KJR84191.1 hypothetical protein SPSK_10008 [Sporothrix schenckii 1099-18]